MLATLDGDGTLNARPVATVGVDDGGVVWVFIAATGGIAQDLQRGSRAYLCVMDVGKDIYVWLRGHGALVDYPAKVKALWNTFAGAWFPGGPTDPSLGLLRVEVEQGDYWDVTSSKIAQFFMLAKAALTKTSPAEETGTHKQFKA